MRQILSDDMIITLYWNRNEQAIAETDSKYGPYCYRVAHNVLSDPEDSEECVNDTWLHAWNVIPPERPNILRSFLAKITRNLSLDRYRQRTAAKRGGGETELALEELEESIPGNSRVEEAISEQELALAINRFLSTLPKRDGDIFLRRYFYMDPTSVIASSYDINERNCLVILSRTRKKLKEHLEKEGFAV